MDSELSIPLATMQSFLFVLMRMSGILVFIPLPGMRNVPMPVKAALAIALTVALLPFWPVPAADHLTLERTVAWAMAEAALGLSAGLVVAFLLEVFQMAAQLIALQAGFGYASTIDPTSEADSSVLQVMGQLVAALLFVVFGFDRVIFAAFARSLQTYPPGAYAITMPSADAIIRLGSTIFSTGLRLAFPVIALLMLIDIVLALLSRVNAQLQLLSLAFPIKILASLTMLAMLTSIFPAIFREAAARSLEAFARVMGV